MPSLSPPPHSSFFNFFQINAILVRLIDTHSVPPGDNKAIGRLLKAFWEEVEKVRANGPEVAKMAREILSKK